MKRALLAWAALVVPLWLVLALCTYWEPIVRDGWSNTYWYLLNDLSPGRLAQYVKDSWFDGNPRLGQSWTLLMYWPGPFHVITTPLLELAMFALLTALALGRWPSIRRADDALVALVVTAVVCACTPQIGPMLFYRAFTGNYLFGLVLNLAWLIPYRFFVEDRREGRWWWAPALAVLGVAAGMCNEHTGPAFIALGALGLVAAWRAPRVVKTWMIAGLVGLVVGYALLIFAPGHDHRYGGLAREAGMLERILDRGVVANIKIVSAYLMYLLYALPWLALGAAAWFARSPAEPALTTNRRALLALAAGGLVCTLTLLASPKLGPRLYLASVALAGVAIAGWICMQLRARWTRVACAVISATVLAYGAYRCISIYRVVGPIGATRHRILHDTPNGQRVVVPRYPVGTSRWFLGDDFLVDSLRVALARDYGLISVDLEPKTR